MRRHSLLLSQPWCRGFSLVEILVVIAIIAILAALLFPAARSFIEKGHLAKCTTNLRQIGVGMQGYLADNNGTYPLTRAKTEQGKPWAGPFWADQIEPYTGSKSEELFKHIGTTGQHCFYCPSTKGHHGISDYGVNTKVILQPGTTSSSGLRAASITQPSRTILALDAGWFWPNKSGIPMGDWLLSTDWVRSPSKEPFTQPGPVPRHGNLLNVLFCDGNVQTMTYDQLLQLHPRAFEIQ